ncbi:DUF6318 family protein [Nocardioides sp. CPCC 205120]|uniref:DUF6318 family protein n=1 Tax=Nocardioides sp. CPCC 205120 TaxID=3406462 RepID=UPI003B5100A6
MRLRRRLLACTLAGTTALTACTSDSGDTDDDAEPSDSTSSSSAPVESTTTAPTPPPLPDEATGDDDAAAIAFVEHWVELLNYGFATGDTAPARQTAAACSTCMATLDYLDETFGQGPVGAWRLSNLEAVPPDAGDAAATDVVVVADVLVIDDIRRSTTEGRSGTFAFGLTGKVGPAPWALIWSDGEEA